MKEKIKKAAILFVLVSALSAALIMQVFAPGPSPVEPLLNFRFLVEIDGIAQTRFMEVEGLKVEIDVIEYREGGDGSPTLIPGVTKYGPLILRNGFTDNQELLWWVGNVTEGNIQRKSMSIIILNARNEETTRYNVYEAWPSSWSMGKLTSSEPDVLIEELVIQYEFFEKAA